MITAISPAMRNHELLTSTSLPAIVPTLNVPGGRRSGARPPRSSLMRRGYPNHRASRGYGARRPALSVASPRFVVMSTTRRALTRRPPRRAAVDPGRRRRRARSALAEPGRRDFMTCPLLYRYRTIDQLPEEPSADALRGTLVHKVLEDLFDLPAADRTPDRARDLLVPDLGRPARGRARRSPSCSPSEGPDVAEWLASCRSVLDRYFTLEDPRRLEPAERELYVEALLDSRLLLRGFVDRLDVAPDGAIRVVDYKTGRSPGEMFEAKALFQMKFYALVIWRTRGVVPAMLQLVYLGNGEMLRYVPDEADLLATERKVEAIWQAIRRAEETGDWRPQRARALRLVLLPGPVPRVRRHSPAAARPGRRQRRAHRRGPRRRGHRSLTAAGRLALSRRARCARPTARPGSGRRRRSAGRPRSGAPSRCARRCPSRRAICLLARPWRTSDQHLALARGQVGGRGRRRTPGAEQLAGGPRVDRRLAPGDGPDAAQHLVGLGVLEQVAHRAGVEGARRSAPRRSTTSAPARRPAPRRRSSGWR